MPVAMHIFVVLVFGFFISSCSSRHIPSHAHLLKKLSGPSQESVDYIRQQEARLDIPFPLSLEPVKERCTESSMLTFKSNMSIDNLLSFYTCNMEGWKLKTHFVGQEHLLMFDRPGRRACAISIRPCDDDGGISELVVFIGSKQNTL